MKKNVLRNERGFTLIEIIAVLVILGILAAVAVPKFFDMQEQARIKVMQGALAEGMSTCSLGYARLVLGGTTATAALVAAQANANKPGSDDFTYTFAADASGVTVTVAASATGAASGAASVNKVWLLPVYTAP